MLGFSAMLTEHVNPEDIYRIYKVLTDTTKVREGLYPISGNIEV